jgi:hypothetical protein
MERNNRKFDFLLIIFISLRSFITALYKYTGAAFIYSKWTGESTPQSQSTFFLWMISIYLGAHTIATERYYKQYERVEKDFRENISLFANGHRLAASVELQNLQFRRISKEPDILKPNSIVQSLFGKNQPISGQLKLRIDKQVFTLFGNAACKVPLYQTPRIGALGAVELLFKMLAEIENYEEFAVKTKENSLYTFPPNISNLNKDCVNGEVPSYTFVNSELRHLNARNNTIFVQGKKDIVSDSFFAHASLVQYGYNSELIIKDSTFFASNITLDKKHLIKGSQFIFSRVHVSDIEPLPLIDYDNSNFFMSDLTEVSVSCEILKYNKNKWNVSNSKCEDVETFDSYHDLILAFLNYLTSNPNVRQRLAAKAFTFKSKFERKK